MWHPVLQAIALSLAALIIFTLPPGEGLAAGQTPAPHPGNLAVGPVGNGYNPDKGFEASLGLYVGNNLATLKTAKKVLKGLGASESQSKSAARTILRISQTKLGRFSLALVV